MPITIAADIIETAQQVYLNDPNGTEATPEKLLPFLKEAYKFLESELETNGVQCKNAEVIAIIPANSDEYYPLPYDLVVPNTMYERAPNSNEEFRPMSYRNNIPQIISTTYLQFWTYRLERIYVLAASQDREIKLLYQRSFPAIETTDAVLFGKAEQYLAAKVSALYNLFVRQSTTLADVSEGIAAPELEDIINIQVKIGQSQTIRRKPYKP